LRTVMSCAVYASVRVAADDFAAVIEPLLVVA